MLSYVKTFKGTSFDNVLMCNVGLVKSLETSRSCREEAVWLLPGLCIATHSLCVLVRCAVLEPDCHVAVV